MNAPYTFRAPSRTNVSKAKATGSLGSYMRDLESCPKLSREAESALVARFQAGDRKAADELIRGSLRLVVYIARRYKASSVPVEDLIAEGNLALLHALRKYDPSFGTRFSSYARLWIRAYLTRYVRRGRSLVSTPLHDQAALLAKVRAERAKVSPLVRAEKVDTIVAERIGTTVEEIRAVEARFSQRDVSFDVPARDELPSLHEMVASDALDPCQLASIRELHRMLCEAVTAVEMSDLERTIVERRLLCEPGDEPSLAQLGREIGISREWARRLESRAVARVEAELARRRELRGEEPPGHSSNGAPKPTRGTTSRARA